MSGSIYQCNCGYYYTESALTNAELLKWQSGPVRKVIVQCPKCGNYHGVGIEEDIDGYTGFGFTPSKKDLDTIPIHMALLLNETYGENTGYSTYDIKDKCVKHLTPVMDTITVELDSITDDMDANEILSTVSTSKQLTKYLDIGYKIGGVIHKTSKVKLFK